MATLKFDNLNKIYDNNVQAVFDFCLDVEDKEFIVFVGPSGCGKSTTLRMVAGLEDITYGDLYIDDKLVNDVQPKDRDIAMVFQNYALFPHMTVFKNIAFGIKMRKIPDVKIMKNGEQKQIYRHYTKQEISDKVHEAAEILGLTEYLDRKPGALSGGQRQRVALGRAIVRNPKVFLMDEPLSNLDAKLRVQMRSEIIRIHETVGATTIYVTHDQTEAMTMADRIVVMKSGYIQQIGKPEEVYNDPANVFVAGFIGSPAMNFVNGRVIGGVFNVNGEHCLQIQLTKEQQELLKDVTPEQEIVLGVRPEHCHTYDGGEVKLTNFIDVKCYLSELLGSDIIAYTDIDGQKISVKTNDQHPVHTHDEFKVAFEINKMYFFDKETGNRIKEDSKNEEK